MNASFVVRGVGVALALTVAPRVAFTQDVVAAAIDTFTIAHARDAGDTMPAPPRIVGHVDAPPVTLFVSGTHVGVSAGGRGGRRRIGWLRVPFTVRGGAGLLVDTLIGPSWFDLAPGDSAIAGTAVTMAVAHVDSAPLRMWRTMVAQSPVTPLSTLLALLRADSSLGWAVAMSPRLISTGSPWPTLMTLASANGQVALVVVRNPTATRHGRDLVRLAEQRPGVQDVAMRMVLGNLHATLSAGPVDERVAIALLLASWTRHVDSVRPAIAALPAVQHSETARTILALMADTSHTGPPAVSSERVSRVIARIEADTGGVPVLPLALGNALVGTRTVQSDRRLLRRLASLNGHAAGDRWRETRIAALTNMSWSGSPEEVEFVATQLADSSYWHRDLPPIPRFALRPRLDSIRLRIGTSFAGMGVVARSREGVVAQMLLRNKNLANDRPALEALATLPGVEFGLIPVAAATRLKELQDHP